MRPPILALRRDRSDTIPARSGRRSANHPSHDARARGPDSSGVQKRTGCAKAWNRWI